MKSRLVYYASLCCCGIKVLVLEVDHEMNEAFSELEQLSKHVYGFDRVSLTFAGRFRSFVYVWSLLSAFQIKIDRGV